jgi:hypothetical protein
MSLDRRAWMLRCGLAAMLPCLAIGAAVVRAQAPAAQQYEVESRWLIVHQLVNQKATPVPVEAAAAAHAAMIASPRVAEMAITKFRLAELQTLKDLPRDQVARVISGSMTAVGKPSTEVPTMSVFEVRCRSTSVNDAMTIVKALAIAYEEYVHADAKDAGIRLARAERDVERLTGQCETLRRLGPASELPEAERLLKETSSELPILRLKHRVQSFDVVTEFVGAKKVETP